MMGCVGILVFRGSSTIEGFLSFWSLVLYVTYALFFLWCFTRFGSDIVNTFATSDLQSGWVRGGLEYAAYNVGIVPCALFAVRHIERRGEALAAGLLAGPIAIIPGLMFYLAAVSQYPEILTVTIPANYLLSVLGSRSFQLIFQIVLLGTLIETGTGLIHAFNERISGRIKENNALMPSLLRPTIAAVLLVTAALIARFGLVDLIAQGYGTITWGFWLVFVIPTLTLGTWKVLRKSGFKCQQDP